MSTPTGRPHEEQEDPQDKKKKKLKTTTTTTTTTSPVRLTSQPSPISAKTVAMAGMSFGDMHTATTCSSNNGGGGGSVYFTCSDPEYDGKYAIRKYHHHCSDDDKDNMKTSSSSWQFVTDPASYNVRSAVHEYGGGAFACGNDDNDGVVFTTFPNHIVYHQFVDNKDGSVVVRQIFPREIGTASSASSKKKNCCRLADMSVITTTTTTTTTQQQQQQSFVLAIMEDHSDESNVVNSIVVVTLDGSAEVRILAAGYDFYASPVYDPISQRLAFVAWKHPNMPWDMTQLFVTEPITEWLNTSKNSKKETLPENTPVEIIMPQQQQQSQQDEANKDASYSVYNPQWHNGDLYFLANPTGWYNLYCSSRRRHHQDYNEMTAAAQALYPKMVDFAMPSCGWILGCRCFTFLPKQNALVAVYNDTSPAMKKEPNDDSTTTTSIPRESGARIVVIDIQSKTLLGEFGRSCLPPTNIDTVTACSQTGALYFFGGSPTMPRGLWCWERPGDVTCIAQQVFAPTIPNLVEIQSAMSEPKSIQFPSDPKLGVGYAYGYYYPPFNTSGCLPPLLVKAHGGPTSRTSTTFRLDIQYWTSRGFAVLDVDYSGSTGYGRTFQQSLKGQWGLLDVADVCHGAKYCCDEQQGWVNPNWLCIDGKSAGGYTTLAALVFAETFQAGASLYGIGDLLALAKGTHKFESRYLDGLIGSYPEAKQMYKERSPVNYTDKLDCPVILLQGDEDKVVPPEQAEQMYKVLTDKGLPTTLVMYKGEQHGFRKPEHVQHALSSEYYFFSSVFGIEPQPEEGFRGVRIGSRVDV